MAEAGNHHPRNSEAEAYWQEAAASYRRVIELRPQFAEAWNNLGTALRYLKNFAEAENAYRKALALRPDEAEMLNNLALCLKDLGRTEEAAALLQRALAIDERNSNTLLHLATILLDQRKVEEAAALARHALALEPANPAIANLMGHIEFDRHDLAKAEAQYRRALELEPNLPDALNNMGIVLEKLGRLDESRAAFLKSLAFDPGATSAYLNYADSIKFTADDPHLKAMEAIRAENALGNTGKMQLDFALAKAYGDLNDHSRSFERLLSANAIKRTQIEYDESAIFALFDRIESVFTEELLREKEKLNGGDPSAAPIFVFGMPRSGTTLIEQILASHPNIFGAGELKALNDVIGEVRDPDGNSLFYPEFVPGLNAPSLGRLGAQYLAQIRKLAPDAARITDKMPSNYYFAGLIHLALPNARLIHVMRDPLDNCMSCFSKLFSDEQNYAYDLAELGRYYRRYQKLMTHWRRVLPETRILDVRYEDVVENLEGQARRIIAYCGLEWSEKCLSFHATDRPVRTASASQVRQPIYKNSVGRAEVHKQFIGPLLTALSGN